MVEEVVVDVVAAAAEVGNEETSINLVFLHKVAKLKHLERCVGK